MSNENKETTAAPEGAEQQSGQEPETAASKAQKAKTEAKPKAQKAKSEAESGTNALRAVGLAACKRHELAQVWVTSDGQAFEQEGDAKAHARNLPSKETLKVSAK